MLHKHVDDRSSGYLVESSDKVALMSVNKALLSVVLCNACVMHTCALCKLCQQLAGTNMPFEVSAMKLIDDVQYQLAPSK